MHTTPEGFGGQEPSFRRFCKRFGVLGSVLSHVTKQNQKPVVLFLFRYLEEWKYRLLVWHKWWILLLNCIYGDRLVNSLKGWESIPKFAGCATGISLKYEENAIKRI